MIPFGTYIVSYATFGYYHGFCLVIAVELEGAGYYTIDAAITVTPDAIGNITIAANLDNVPIPAAAAIGSVDTISDSVTLPITATVRMGCCCEGASQLTFTIDNAADLVSASVRVEKA